MNMKEENAILKVNEYTVLDIAVSSDEGDKINQRIHLLLERYQKVTIDFSGITLLTSAFLNAAIGQLYNDFNSEELASRLFLSNVSKDDLPLFKKVTDRAKEYFKNEQEFSKTTKEILDKLLEVMARSR